jgi:hypothetical protein
MEYQPHILIGDHGANSHVAHNHRHRARREFMGSHVTPPAIRSKSLFSFDPHGAFIENPRGFSAMRGGCWRVRAASAR